MRKIIGVILYNMLGKYMPSSYSKLSFGAKYIRRFCGKLILCKCGKNVNIEKGAVFSSRVELGDNSGIGIRAGLGGKIIIGKNVMMGPDCVIYTQNHAFDRLDIPMCEQGVQIENQLLLEMMCGLVVVLPYYWE